MSNIINFSEVPVEKPTNTNTTQYCKPGIHDLTVTNVELKMSGSGSYYIDFIYQNPSNEIVSRQYYLNTAPGASGKSALEISVSSIKKLSTITKKEELLNSVSINTEDTDWREKFTNKIASIFVGTRFRNKLKGKEIEMQNGNRFIKAEVSDAYESIETPVSSSYLRFDAMKDIKYLPVTNTAQAEGKTDDLPF